MKKTTKASIALAGAVALLLSGGGTLAYWNATATVPGGTIDSGSLDLVSTCADADWTVSNTIEGVTDAAFDPDTDAIIPGDVLTKSCTIVVNLVGDNLRVALGVTDPGTAGSTLPTDSYELTSTFLIDDETIGELTAADTGATIDVEIELDFGIGAVVDNASQDGVLDLDDFVVTATQVTS